MCSLPLVGVEQGGNKQERAPNWHSCKAACEEEQLISGDWINLQL